jgi:hypothetical protein
MKGRESNEKKGGTKRGKRRARNGQVKKTHTPG